ncbi:MAG: hypothetical protein ABI678_01675 [Kofleriaceae bacterium]
MRIAWLVAAVVAVGGCKKDAAQAPGGPASTADLDALWKLAPADALFGVVASPRALVMTQHAWDDVVKFMAATPDLAPVLTEMRAELTKELGTADLQWSAIGWTDTKGVAIFQLANKKALMVLPVVDEPKWKALLAKQKHPDEMKCQQTHGVYACSDDPAAFDQMGKGTLSAALANARGDVEMAGKLMPGARDASTLELAIVAQLAPGTVVVRGGLRGAPKRALDLAGAPASPRTDGDHTTGFALLNLKGLYSQIPDFGPFTDAVHSIEDPATLVATSTGMDVRAPLGDPAPIKKLIEQYCEVGPLAQLGAQLVNGGCELQLPNMPPEFKVRASVDGKTLVVATAATAKPVSVDNSPLGKELAAGKWQFAFFGRGSLLGGFQGMGGMPAVPPEAAMYLHLGLKAMALINEMGAAVKIDGDTIHFVFGLRTAFGNPPDVVAKLIAIDPDQIIAGKGGEIVKPIIAAAPSSPLAQDVKAGYMGLMLPTMGIGMMSAIAIPAFMDYMKKSKKSEASLQLNKLGKNLKTLYIENAAFPVGDAPLTPTKPCCGQPQNKCAVDLDGWKQELWQKLDFQIDEPNLYRYSYHSDGKTAQVVAQGDADCDGQEATYTLDVTTENGNPMTAITPPPSGVY